MRVVLDTNVVVAGLRSRQGASRLWLTSILRGEHTAIISVALMLEYEDVLSRADQLAAFKMTKDQIGRFLDGLCSVAEHASTANLWRPLLRDPNDEMVLEAAVQGNAEVILTFNARDFLGCERFGIAALAPGPAWHRRHK